MNEEPHKEEQPGSQGQAPGNPPPPARKPHGGSGNDGGNGGQVAQQHQEPPKKRRFPGTLPEWLMVLFTAGICYATYSYTQVASGQLHAMNDQLWEQKHEGWATSNQLRGQLSALNGQVNAQATTAAAAKSAADTAASTLSENKTAASEQLQRLDKSIRAANLLASAADRTARAAATANVQSATQFRVEERPWIAMADVDQPIITNYSGGAITVIIFIKNFGKTPALHVVSDVTATIFLPHQYPIAGRTYMAHENMLAKSNSVWHNTPVLGPGAKAQMGVTISPNMVTSLGGLDAARNTPWSWIVMGEVTYQDEPRKPHDKPYYSLFCVINPGGYGMGTPCNGYNSV